MHNWSDKHDPNAVAKVNNVFLICLPVKCVMIGNTSYIWCSFALAEIAAALIVLLLFKTKRQILDRLGSKEKGKDEIEVSDVGTGNLSEKA